MQVQSKIVLQNTPDIDELIVEIANLQSKGNDCFQKSRFPKGIFPAQRFNRFWLYYRQDTNVFQTAITVFTLNQVKNNLSEVSQQFIKKITKNAHLSYNAYRNKDGLCTYNNWETCPSKHFPNGYIARHFDHFRIPDDIDDTALVYLTLPHTRQELLNLKEKLPQHANLSHKQITNTLSQYRELRAYSTWFGENMYIDFDACALSNLLLLILKENLPWNNHDTDSLAYIVQCLATSQHLTKPFSTSHHYPRPALILYHVARLMHECSIEQLEPLREKLCQDAEQLLKKEHDFMEKIVLAIALKKFCGNDAYLSFPPNWQHQARNYSFFSGGLLTSYENSFLYALAHSPLTHIQWRCEAHSLALIVEYLALRKE